MRSALQATRRADLFEQVLLRALEVDPSFVEVYGALAVFYRSQGRTADARAMEARVRATATAP